MDNGTFFLSDINTHIIIRGVYMADNKNMQDMLKQMSQQLNLSENELKSAAKKGNANSIFKNADSKTQKTVEEILNDPQKTKELLESPQAKAIIEMLRKGK